MFRSYPTRNLKFRKNSNKIQKIKIYHYGSISSQNRLVKAEKEKKQLIIDPYRSYPTQNRKFQKIAKKFKNLKNTIMALFQGKIGWKRIRKRENKNYHYVSFLSDA